MKESFEVRWGDENSILIVVFILNSTDDNRAIKKLSYKQNIIYSNSIKGFKIVFTLLTKLVAFYVSFILIYFQSSSLKKML